MRTVVGTLDWGRADLGYDETPVNRTKYAAQAGHQNGLAWCATFQVAWSKATDQPLPRGANTAYTPAMADAFKAAGRWTRNPQAGDLGFVYYRHLGRIGHVFRVEHVEEGRGTVVTIEGNTNAGGSRTGGGVARLRRPILGGDSYGTVVGYGRMTHKPGVERPNLEVDGKWDRETRKAIREELGLKRGKGVLGPKARRRFRARVGLRNGTTLGPKFWRRANNRLGLPDRKRTTATVEELQRNLRKGRLW